jgi:hypothetical protein
MTLRQTAGWLGISVVVIIGIVELVVARSEHRESADLNAAAQSFAGLDSSVRTELANQTAILDRVFASMFR